MAESLALTDFKNLANLYLKYQDRNEARSEVRPIYALDTETDENGNVTLIADSLGNYLELDEISAENLVRFLFSKRYQGSWNFFYNITFDAEVILKTFGKVLFNYKKTRKLNLRVNAYRFKYLPQKMMAVRKAHHSSVFFNIAQYYKTSLYKSYKSKMYN